MNSDPTQQPHSRSLIGRAMHAAPVVIAGAALAGGGGALAPKFKPHAAPTPQAAPPINVTYNQVPVVNNGKRSMHMEKGKVIVRIVGQGQNSVNSGSQNNGDSTPDGGNGNQNSSGKHGGNSSSPHDKPGRRDTGDPTEVDGHNSPTVTPTPSVTPDSKTNTSPNTDPTPEGADARFRATFLDTHNNTRTYLKGGVAQFTTLADDEDMSMPEPALGYDQLSNSVVVAWEDPEKPDSLRTEVFTGPQDLKELIIMPKGLGGPAPTIETIEGPLSVNNSPQGFLSVGSVNFGNNTQFGVPDEVATEYGVTASDGKLMLNLIPDYGAAEPTQ